MTELRPVTGPVTLPPDPRAVANGRVHDLAGLGTLHRPPTKREYEHAALDVALVGTNDAEVYAVLTHLGDQALDELGIAAHWLESAVDAELDRRRDSGR